MPHANCVIAMYVVTYRSYRKMSLRYLSSHVVMKIDSRDSEYTNTMQLCLICLYARIVGALLDLRNTYPELLIFIIDCHRSISPVKKKGMLVSTDSTDYKKMS